MDLRLATLKQIKKNEKILKKPSATDNMVYSVFYYGSSFLRIISRRLSAYIMRKNDKHFNYTFTYIILGTVFVSLYILACTFLEIPKDNLRFADTSLGILLGWMISNGNYLTGGSPPIVKKPAGETTAEINASITTTEDGDKG